MSSPEDTRRLRRLDAGARGAALGRVVSYFRGHEAARTPSGRGVAGGARGAACDRRGDAVGVRPGVPLVAAGSGAGHQGHRRTGAVRRAHRARAVGAAGGPVLLRGVPAQEGRERLSRLREVAASGGPSCTSRPPHRLDDTLAAMAEVFGAERAAAVCRELTKTYEEIKRGRSASWPPGRRRACAARSPSWGGGAGEDGELDADELVRRVRVREEAGSGERKRSPRWPWKRASKREVFERGGGRRVRESPLIFARNSPPSFRENPSELGRDPSEQGAPPMSARPMAGQSRVAKCKVRTGWQGDSTRKVQIASNSRQD